MVACCARDVPEFGVNRCGKGSCLPYREAWRRAWCCFCTNPPYDNGAVFLPPGAHPRDIFLGLALVTFAMLWAFLVSLTNNEVLYQFPLLTLVAVLATGGLEEENLLHNLLAAAAGLADEEDGRYDGNWNEWTQKWKPLEAKRYINRVRSQLYLRIFRWCRFAGISLGLCGFLALPLVLLFITKAKSTVTETDIGTDLAPSSSGLLALCGSSNCEGLSPRTVDALGVSGAWTRQSLWCNDTTSIECRDPLLRQEYSGEESAFAFVLQIDSNETTTATERLQSLSLQIIDSNGTEVVGVKANSTIDGLWWTMNDDSTYVKIRWSPNEATYSNNSWHNEDIFIFSGLTSVETQPSTATPLCFSQNTTKDYDHIPDSTRTTVMRHSLSDSDTREILRSSYLNTFFTNGLTGNPYQSVRACTEGPESNQLLGAAVLANTIRRSNSDPVNCAAGAGDDDAEVVEFESFINSPQLQADRTHVVWAGDFSWQIEKITTSKFFTEQYWEGEDVLTLAILGLFLAVFLGFAIRVLRFPITNGPHTEGIFAMAGSLVGRITLALIMAEGSVFLAIRLRGGDVSDSNVEAAKVAAQTYKYLSWLLLGTIFVGDGIYAPLCWFRDGDRVRTYEPGPEEP